MITRRLQYREYKELIAEQQTAQRTKGGGSKHKSGLRPFRRPVNELTGQHLVGEQYKKWLAVVAP